MPKPSRVFDRQPIDGCVHPVVKVHKSVGRPQPLLKLFARDSLAGPRQQQGQNFKWLPVKLNSHPALAEFSCVQVCLKGPKSDDSGTIGGFCCHVQRFSAQSVPPPPEAMRGSSCEQSFELFNFQ